MVTRTVFRTFPLQPESWSRGFDTFLKALKLLALSSLSIPLLASAAHAEPRKPTHIACVGDSITEGGGPSGYVSQLKLLLGDGVDVQNFGRSGATMLSEGFGDNPYNLHSQYTDATEFVDNAPVGAVVSVVIVLGANDSKPFNWDQAGKPEQYKKDYLALVDHFLGLKSNPVVYVGFPLATGDNPCCGIRGDIIYEQQIPLIKQVAMERHLPIIDLNTDTTNHPEYFRDGVHPNEAGYLVMTQLVKKGLEREPTVSISSPLMGAMPGAGMLPLTADVLADNVDITAVEFFEGATSLGKVMTAPFTVSWPATVGPHTITAKATDATLADKVSDPVTFTVKDAIGGGGGGASSAGAAGAGMTTAGSPSAGTGASGTSSAGTASGGSTSNPTTPVESDAGCGCSVPGSRGAGAAAWLLLAVVPWLRRRRAA